MSDMATTVFLKEIRHNFGDIESDMTQVYRRQVVQGDDYMT